MKWLKDELFEHKIEEEEEKEKKDIKKKNLMKIKEKSIIDEEADELLKKVNEYDISKGANVNIKDDFGQTPLHLAIKAKNFEVADILIMFGADMNIKNDKGATILHDCLYDGDEKMLKYIFKSMLKQGSSIIYNPKDNQNYTPLLYGFIKGNKQCLKFLLLHEKVN